MVVAVRLHDARQDALAAKEGEKGKAAEAAKRKVEERHAGEEAALDHSSKYGVQRFKSDASSLTYHLSHKKS